MKTKLILSILLSMCTLVGCQSTDAQTTAPEVVPSTVQEETTTENIPTPTGVTVGNIAQDFTLKNLSGETVTLSDYRGKTVILNFFATWCGPCKAETADLKEIYDETKDDVVVLSVNLISTEQGGVDDVKAYIDDQNVTYTVLLDVDNAVSDTYRVRALPTNIFINGEGAIVYRHIGEIDKATYLTYLANIEEN